MKLASTATLRAQYNKTPVGPSMKETLTSQQHKRAALVIEWLRANWDGEAIVLPLPVNTQNRPMHWSLRDALKQQYHSHCDLLVMAGLIPPAPEPIPAIWRVSVAFYGAGDTDEDNGRALMKPAWDWLVRHHYAQDDNRHHLKVVDFVNGVDRRCPRLEFRTVGGDEP